MEIRKATIKDLEKISAVEAACFNEAEAASAKSIKARLEMFPDCFWLAFEDKKLIGFVDGMKTNESDLLDEMYEDALLHSPQGARLMIFGVCTLPSFQGKGIATSVLNACISDCREQGLLEIVLTCKDALVGFYKRFDFVDEGISDSYHGGVIWHQMRLKL
ncbi:MAG: GNAT family N-acetyltransferase [Ruminococcus sp.]|nr:GNAT family N-acetyltransferase [Ruminococcus sp.]